MSVDCEVTELTPLRRSSHSRRQQQLQLEQTEQQQQQQQPSNELSDSHPGATSASNHLQSADFSGYMSINNNNHPVGSDSSRADTSEPNSQQVFNLKAYKMGDTKRVLARVFIDGVILLSDGNPNAAADDAALRAMVTEINAKLAERDIEQRLVFIRYEWDKPIGEFLVLCNTFASVGPSPMYNEAECIYMKNLMDSIVTSDTHSISVMTTLHLSSGTSTQASQSQSTSKKITKQRAEELLDEWVSAAYFLRVNDDEEVTLGPRAIAEFRDTLRTKFGDYIQNCHLCNELALKPKFCPNDDCEAALDIRCYGSYVLKKKKCPSCKSDWNETE